MQPGKKSLVLNVLTLQPLRAVTQEGGFFPYSKHACSPEKGVQLWSSCSNVLCNNLDETMLKFELPLFPSSCNTTLWHHYHAILRPHQLLDVPREWSMFTHKWSSFIAASCNLWPPRRRLQVEGYVCVAEADGSFNNFCRSSNKSLLVLSMFVPSIILR